MTSKPLLKETDADGSLKARPQPQNSAPSLLRTARYVKADADRVVMPPGFKERVWQKVAADSGGLLKPRPGRHPVSRDLSTNTVMDRGQ